MTAPDEFLAARDFLLDHREDYAAAVDGFTWPQPDEFNWALDHFDIIERNACALWLVHEDGSEERLTFGELTARSTRWPICCAISVYGAATGCCSCWATSPRSG